MPLQHRFADELSLLEQQQIFCGQQVNPNSQILIIGTFNPDNESCLLPNTATWFYGRERNCFWKYLPECLIGQNLHISQNFTVNDWRQFCIRNRIVIVDLIKAIDHNEPLEDYKDKRINDKINNDFGNVTVFDFATAFNNISFEKVIYTRKGWNPVADNEIIKLIQIKNIVNNTLIQNNNINNLTQIKYCPAPWQKRPTTQLQWCEAINGQ